jgi:hypothetical protein
MNKVCLYGTLCDFAHGDKEIEEFENIRNYLNNPSIIEEQNNLKKLYDNIKNEENYIFKIFNIKQCKRLIYDILCFDCFKLTDTEKIFGNIENIVYIYESLFLEYYVNVANEMPNEPLKVKLIQYFKKFVNENETDLLNNKWILYYFQQIEKIVIIIVNLIFQILI